VDLIQPFVKHVSWDFYHRRDGRNARAWRKTLKSSQYLSADELHTRQFQKLKRLLIHAFKYNAFYRKRLTACGYQHAEDMQDMSDLRHLPILTKDEIRDELCRAFSSGYSEENTKRKRTGGSTGTPLHNYWDFAAASYKLALAERHNTWAHLHPGNRLACIWGDTDRSLSCKARLRESLTRRGIYLDTLRFDEQHIERFIQQVRRYRPPALMGHAHSVFQFAEYCRDQGIEDITFRGIVSTAMVLRDSEREVIEEVFGTRVFNRYGCEEVSIIASECESHEGLHICAEGIHVEYDDLGDNGDRAQPRSLIISDLVNRAMPIIRYEVGDYGVPLSGACACGRGLPRIKELAGRTADFLYRPDGSRVFGVSILDTFVIHIPGVKQMQIVQHQLDHIDVNIVRDAGFSETTTRLIEQNIREIFGEEMKHTAHFVEKIAQSGRGKFRFSICHVAAPVPVGKLL
jgi:phenylacetate-CoA ligase